MYVWNLNGDTSVHNTYNTAWMATTIYFCAICLHSALLHVTH